MAKKQSISPLFTPSGCLAQKTILGYLEGTLIPEDHSSVKEHLNACRLCQDAVEGLAKGKNARVTDHEIASINKQIFERTSAISSRRLQPVIKRLSITKTWTVAAAAASVILFVGIYLLLQQPGREYPGTLIAFNDTTLKEEDGMLPGGQAPVPDSKKVTTKEGVTAREASQPEPEAVVPSPPPISIPEESEAPSDGLASSGESSPLSDSLVNVPEIKQTVVVELEDRAVAEPPSELDRMAVGGVSAGKEKSAYRTVNRSQAMLREEDIFTVAEQWPEFPGGNDSLDAFLAKNLRYPEEALARNTEGKVYLTFVVEKDGTLSDVRVLRGISDECNEEAIRLVTSMPPWIPGRQNNTPVRVQYNLPIHFQFPD